MGELKTARDALADMIVAGCPLVRRAYNYVPPAVPAAELPAVIVTVGSGTYDYTRHGAQVISTSRTLTVTLLVSEYMAGRFPVQEKQLAAIDVFEQVQAYLLTNRRMTTTANPAPTKLNLSLVSDNGIAARQYGDMYYVGTEFTISTQYTITTTFI